MSFLADLSAIDAQVRMVEDFVAYRTASHFESDLELQYAVRHAFRLLADRLSAIDDVRRLRYPEVAWDLLVSAGTLHAEVSVLWAAATEQLAPLRAALRTLPRDV